MLLPTGEKTITVDAVAQAWTGRWPVNRAPVLGTTAVPLAGRRVAGNATFAVSGPYRLFVTVRDGHGSGCIDNWPFFVDR